MWNVLWILLDPPPPPATTVPYMMPLCQASHPSNCDSRKSFILPCHTFKDCPLRLLKYF